jgi:hypothetical protein
MVEYLPNKLKALSSNPGVWNNENSHILLIEMKNDLPCWKAVWH